jgi:hypothetical protein
LKGGYIFAQHHKSMLSRIINSITINSTVIIVIVIIISAAGGGV